MDKKDIAILLLIDKGNVTRAEMVDFLNIKIHQLQYRMQKLIKAGLVNKNLPGSYCTKTLTEAGYDIAKKYTMFFDPNENTLIRVVYTEQYYN